MRETKIRKIGNSFGVILPKETLDQLGVAEGDTVFLSDTPDGVALRPHEQTFEDQMQVARQIMKKRRKALRELSK
jgi:putative addiction module antidote